MATKKIKKRLGMGMEALLKNNLLEKEIYPSHDENKNSEKNSNTVLDANAILHLEISKIEPNKNQPRNYFNEDKIKELAISIKNHGILQPLLVVKKENNLYSLVAGERRLRAAKKADFKTVPVRILSLSEEEIFESALIENLQREDLNPIEIALSFKNLLRIKNMTHQELAIQLGVSRASITNSLRLLTLPENIQHHLIKNNISPSHARAILSLSDEKAQQTALKNITENKLSVHTFTAKNKKSQKNKDKNLLEYQNKLIEYFGTNVHVNGNLNKGFVKIEYYNETDFDRIIKLCGVKDL